jgi:hypothetical protein
MLLPPGETPGKQVGFHVVGPVRERHPPSSKRSFLPYVRYFGSRYPRRVVTESRPVMWRRYPRLLRSLYRHVPPAGPWTFNRHTAHRGAVARVEQAFRKTRACAPWRIALPRLGASGPTAVAGYLMPSASGRKLHVTHDYRGVTQSILHAAPSCRVAVPQTIAAQYVIVACRVGIPSALVIHAPRLSS